MNWQEIIEGLSQGHNQLRLAAVRSETGALLLDDAYNASPESVLAALSLLDELDGRKVAVLGDMLELGQYERGGHEMVGLRAGQVADVVVTLGPRGRMIADAARRSGMKKTAVLEFDEITALTNWLSENLTRNDVVLIKGSHGLRMDRITAALEVRS
jgi:UDP-N-acetylmuramoyl-tripeptide--D-alanyl-D-alanine ligase